MNEHEKFMHYAYLEALKAYKENEIPVGAIILDKDNKVIAKAHNKKNKCNDVTAHAEILAIKKASKKLKSWHLDECKIYITVEPCLMCSSAILQSRIKSIYYGVESTFNELSLKYLSDYLFDNNIEVKGNILSDEISILLSNFFNKIR